MDCLFRIPVTRCKGRVLRRNGHVQSWCWVFLLAIQQIKFSALSLGKQQKRKRPTRREPEAAYAHPTATISNETSSNEPPPSNRQLIVTQRRLSYPLFCLPRHLELASSPSYRLNVGFPLVIYLFISRPSLTSKGSASQPRSVPGKGGHGAQLNNSTSIKPQTRRRCCVAAPRQAVQCRRCSRESRSLTISTGTFPSSPVALHYRPSCHCFCLETGHLCNDLVSLPPPDGPRQHKTTSVFFLSFVIRGRGDGVGRGE